MMFVTIAGDRVLHFGPGSPSTGERVSAVEVVVSPIRSDLSVEAEADGFEVVLPNIDSVSAMFESPHLGERLSVNDSSGLVIVFGTITDVVIDDSITLSVQS